MREFSFVLLFCALALVCGQQAGTSTNEYHPPLSIQQCTSLNNCNTLSTKITLDANWRWLHNVGGYTNCYTGNSWSSQYCADPTACATGCALEGVDSAGYTGTYGITASSSSLRLNFVTQSANKNVGSRVYLMDTDTTYKTFNLLNQEFTFDVNAKELPCGVNSALYFVEMSANGGIGGTNAAGAKFGTGYCDAQCPQDIKFINGAANVLNWQGTTSNSGTGRYGACCPELDIWEANSISTAFTPHPCTIDGLVACDSQTGTDCGNTGTTRYNSVCDKDGCDFNSYRMGNKTFYGPNMNIDTNQPITVVTQFYTDDNTNTGKLTSIKRFYVQNGKVVPNSASTFTGLNNANSIDDTFCDAQKTLFGDTNDFKAKGGLAEMGESMKRGLVLVMSLWDDHAANLLWLDSNYPTTADPATPGVARGTCPITSGVPAEVEAQYPNSYVVFSNIKYGAIGSTYATGTVGTTGSATTAAGSTSGSNAGTTSGSNAGTTSGSNAGTTSGSNAGTTSGSNAGTTASGATTGSDSCPVGSVKCACTQGKTCDAGLTCLSDVCVDAGDNQLPSSSAATLSIFSLAVLSAALYLF